MENNVPDCLQIKQMEFPTDVEFSGYFKWNEQYFQQTNPSQDFSLKAQAGGIRNSRSTIRFWAEVYLRRGYPAFR
jgi:hypothetical protein